MRRKNLKTINFITTINLLDSIIKAFKISQNLYLSPLDLLYGILNTNNLVTNILKIKNKIGDFKSIKKNKYIFSKQILLLFLILIQKNKPITTVDFCIQLLLLQSKQIIFIFIKNFSNINYNKLWNYYKYNSYIFNLPYIKNNYIYSNKIIFGRKYEIYKSINILYKKLNNNILFIGEKKIGKFSIIIGIINTLKTLKINIKKEFFILDVKKLLFQIHTYLDFKKNIQDLFIWLDLYKNNIILIIENINLLWIDTFKFLIESFFFKKVQIIGTIEGKNFENIKEQLIYKNIEIITVQEIAFKDLYLILQQKLKYLLNYYKYTIYPNIIQNIIEFGSKFIKNKTFPLKGFELLETLFIEKLLTKNKHIEYWDFEKLINKLQNKNNILNTTITKNHLKNLIVLIKQRLFGQDKLIENIILSLQKTFLGLKTSNKPIGSWLLCGPSGTGKTELAKTLAEKIFYSEKNLIRFDMSEFMEKHTVSKFLGSPPGYVGYGSKGLLANSLEKISTGILLFDEIEKSHPSISNILLQILDNGHLMDSTGSILNFENYLLIFTSNLGCPKSLSDFKKIKKKNYIIYQLNEYKINLAIKTYFKPEFLNRLQNILIFQPLIPKILLSILNKFLYSLSQKLKDQKFNLTIFLTSKAKNLLIKLSYSPMYGARPLLKIIDSLIISAIIDFKLKFNLKNFYSLIYDVNKINNMFTYTLLKEY